MAADAPRIMQIKVLDVSRFRSGVDSERKEFADELGQALTKDGFVKIINHGISSSMVTDIMAISKRFFELPDTVKRQIEHVPGPQPQRGWSRIGSESTAKLFGALKQDGECITDTDFKEHFDMGSPGDLGYPNSWLDEADAPTMRAFLEEFYECCHEISMTILEAMELALNIRPGTFTDKCGGGASELRINHYPKISTGLAPQEISRVWPHTDLGVITCLFQDGVGGLEIEDRSQKGRFEAVDANSPNELILNISETFERWTNGTVKAGLHNVKLPKSLKSRRNEGEELIVPQRFSIPFFVKADRDACVGALDEFVSEDRPSAYPAMTALEYHMQRLAKAY